MVKASTDAAAKGYDKAVAISKDQVEAAVKAQTVAYKGYEDALAFSKENVEAMVKAGNIFAKGMQDLSKAVISLAQSAVEEHISASKALLSAKTVREFIDLQTEAAKSGVDKAVHEATRLSEQSVKLVEESLHPISERVHLAVDKLAKLTKRAA